MHETYRNPLCERYASREMQFIFSDDNKFSKWRALWVALAESEQELGLGITDEQINELRQNVNNINYEAAERFERELRHDVMAHIRAYGELCPRAKPIIHLGATSCYVGDNAEIIIFKEALLRIKTLLVNAIKALCDFAEKYKNLATLAYTHFQPAQPTTVGKRATLWIQDLLLDLEQLEFNLASLKLLGCKGTTGTCASFLALFDGNAEKVKELEDKIVSKMGFKIAYSVSGQTYSRKVDYYILSVLSGVAQSAYKFSNDIRLLSHLREVEEPFEGKQVGSSAMPYKKNPMRSERMASLSRYVMVNALNPALTASGQWLERTLDDSANKRIAIPEAFLAVDAVLALYINIIEGLSVHPEIIARHLANELPFMATENILMYCVKKGKDRQELHEAIRRHSREEDLLKRICDDEIFGITQEEINRIIEESNFTGMACEQTEIFLKEVELVMQKNKEFLGIKTEIRV